jgi:hypothetical protein
VPGNTSAEDITLAIQEIDYDIISVKQMTAKPTTPEGEVTHTSLPLFLVTVTRNQKAPEIFKLTILSCVSVTKDGVRIGSWIYWILTGRNYK